MDLSEEKIDVAPTKCVLCLEFKDELIAINDVTGQNIVAILCLHFWFTVESIRYQSVCRGCWDCVQVFHRFHQQVVRLYALEDDLETGQKEKDDSFTELDSVPEASKDKTPKKYWQLKTGKCLESGSKEPDQLLVPDENDDHLQDCNDEEHAVDTTQDTELLIEMEEGDFMISNHTELKCPNCAFSTSTFLKLMKHISSTHKTSGFVECCGRKFSKRSRLLDHIIKLQNPNAFSCETCKKVFSGRAGLNEHKLRHNIRSKKGLKCDQCNRLFVKRSQFNLHCQQHATESGTLTCSMCSKIFLNNKSLKGHYQRIHGPDEIICEQCPARFKTLSQFRSHQKAKHTSSEDGRKQCIVCKRWLKNASSLRKHMYRHQSSGKQNVCDVCGKNAPNALALRSHMLFVHRKERSFECTICGKAFKRAFSLQEHMTIHTGNTLYNCAYCSKTFNSNANMHAHKKKAHPKEWEQSRRDYEKKYECQTESASIVV